MNRLRMALYNLLWLITCLPRYCAFRRALSDPKRAQTKALLALLRKHGDTDYGQQHRFRDITSWREFQRLPLTEADDYEAPIQRIMRGAERVLTHDPVEILQPTSGTSSSPKLIPYTQSMGRQFRNGLDPWITDLFLNCPRLLFGPQYWSISPATQTEHSQRSAVPIGFLDDADYFGSSRRWIMRKIMAVPPEVRHIPDVGANHYVTLLFLLRRKQLRLISVWHPSFLTILMDTMKTNWQQCLADVRDGGIHASVPLPPALREQLSRRLKPNRRRFCELNALDHSSPDLCRQLWPQMQLISCWADAKAASAAPLVQRLFPSATLQAKGLLATEGIATLPFGPEQQHVCASTSHILELEDDEGTVHPLWDVVIGKTYQLILTTAGGHYRYRLGDLVEVTGLLRRTPCLRFCGRAGIVSDSVGEKLHITQVDGIIEEISKFHFCDPAFAMLIPSQSGNNHSYKLLIESPCDPTPDLETVAAALDAALCENYHYAHARQLGQLSPATITRLAPHAQNRYRDFMMLRGALAGTVKFPALSIAPGIEQHVVGLPASRAGGLGDGEMPMA